MARLNCWEFKRCGRQPGGPKTAKLGTCPVPTEVRLNACNRGDHAGRACWYLAGTQCEEKVQGIFAEKLGDCMLCDFYRLVSTEEGEDIARAEDVLIHLRRT
jgi:hypothetical protein